MDAAPVFVVDAARTPFLKARGVPGPFAAADLAVQAGRSLLLRQPFRPAELDEVVLGCTAPAPDEANIARLVALRLGCGPAVTAWSVQRNCASGLQAVDSAMAAIRLGRAGLVLAGGVDALSRTPLLYREAMVRWFAGYRDARGVIGKARRLLALRPAALLSPVPALLRGLTDPVAGLSMGQTAENLAWRFGITRAEMDRYAAWSHFRAAAAQRAGALAEIVPLFGEDGRVHAADEGVRPDTSVPALAALGPAFDRPFGTVTAGNSSPISDGAAWLLLASAVAVERWRLRPLARLVDIQWAGVDPAEMGLGPVLAVAPLLARHGLALGDPELWEINEAFAAQVLACLAAWRDDAWCRERLGVAALGALDMERLNVDGGAIALGHPVAASGARVLIHLVHALRARGGRRGVAALCVGGGQGGAALVEMT